MKPTVKNNYIKIVFRNLQFLSIDVVVGALAMELFAARLLQVTPNNWLWVVLALSVWSVYTADHLLDGFSRKSNAVIRRHRMHYQFRTPLLVIMALTVVTALLLTILFLNKTILLGGLFLGFLAILYLTFIRIGQGYRFYFLKQLFISLFYVSGIWLGPVSIHLLPLSPFHWLMIISITLLVWYEGILVSAYEMEKDIKDGHNSFAVTYGTKRSSLFLKLLMIVISSLLLMLFFMADSSINYAAAIVETVMVFSLWLLSRFPGFFQKHEYYKTMGELVFWLPGLLYFVN